MVLGAGPLRDRRPHAQAQAPPACRRSGWPRSQTSSSAPRVAAVALASLPTHAPALDAVSRCWSLGAGGTGLAFLFFYT